VKSGAGESRGSWELSVSAWVLTDLVDGTLWKDETEPTNFVNSWLKIGQATCFRLSRSSCEVILIGARPNTCTGMLRLPAGLDVIQH
jgi:hypothetical protein